MSAGIQSIISIKKESSYGTAVVPNVSIPVRPSGGFEIKKNIQMLQAIKGQPQKYFDSIVGKVEYPFSYQMDAFADNIGYFLLSAIGSEVPTLHASESLVYDHTYTENLSKPSLTIEENISENCRRYAGCVCDGFKLTGKTGESLLYEPSGFAKTQASSTAITPAFSTVPFFNFAQLAIKLGGSLLAEVESIEVDYKNGLEMLYALGNNEPTGFSFKGGSEITVKADLILDNTTLTRLTNYINNTRELFELIATGTDTIGNASHYGLDLLVYKMQYDSAVTKITDQHNLLTISGQGIYSMGDSKLINCVLTNLVSAY